MITASIVTYKTNLSDLKKVLDSLLVCKLPLKIFISDNSPTDELRAECQYDQVEYIFNNANMGYGSGHNVAIRKAMELDADYHIVVNPDIHFDAGNVEKLAEYMDQNSDVGLVIPKVLFPDQSLQYSCHQAPRPFDLILRRFIPGFIQRLLFQKRMDAYEFKDKGYDNIMEVPFLSGCFMFMRLTVLEKVGLFDENIFMYLEDTDLSMRIHQKYKTVFYPLATVYHKQARGSYNGIKLMMVHIRSAIYYFNKWGWWPFY